MLGFSNDFIDWNELNKITKNMKANITKALKSMKRVKLIEKNLTNAFEHIRLAQSFDAETSNELEIMKEDISNHSYAGYSGVITLSLGLFISVIGIYYCNRRNVKKTKNSFTYQLSLLSKDQEVDNHTENENNAETS